MTRVAHIQPNATGGRPPEGRTVVPAEAWEAVGWEPSAAGNRQFHSALETPSPVRGGLGRGFSGGNPTQHLQYMPFGETFVEQRSITSYYTPYTFSAKERDTETGYSYFGARYYSSDISVWLSVDPMGDERSWLSPYNYCQWNPLVLIDPTGALDGWYEDEYGNAFFNKEINSQQDLIDRGISGRYIGGTALIYSSLSDAHWFGDADGNLLPMVLNQFPVYSTNHYTSNNTGEVSFGISLFTSMVSGAAQGVDEGAVMVIGKSAAVIGGVVGLVDNSFAAYNAFSEGNNVEGALQTTQAVGYAVGTALLFTPLAPVGGAILLVNSIIDIGEFFYKNWDND
jgi:RHS repeat-associated protein